MFNRLKRWWRFTGRYIPREIVCGVKNLIRWFPTIWKDRDWDQAYIWDILKVKLEHQAKYAKIYGHHVNSDYDSSRMLLCVKLITLIRDETYGLEYFDYYDKDFNMLDFSSSVNENIALKKSLENLNDYFKKYPLIYKKVINGGGYFNIDTNNERYNELVARNMGYINHLRAIKLLFTVMERNIEGWWD